MQVVNNIVPVPLERLMFYLFDDDQQISWNSTRGFVTLAGHAQLHAVTYAGGDIDRNDFLLHHQPFVIRIGRFLIHYLPVTTAGRTSAGGDHLSQHGVYHPFYLSRSITGRTILECDPRSDHMSFDFYLLFYSLGNLREGQSEFYPQVGSSFGPSSPTTASEKRIKRAATKYITELREYVFHIHTTCTKTSSTHSLMAELVIALAFFRIAQNLISFRSLLEFLFRLGIVWVFVRMVLYRHFSIGFLDFILISIFCYIQYLVIISLCHNNYAPITTLANLITRSPRRYPF